MKLLSRIRDIMGKTYESNSIDAIALASLLVAMFAFTMPSSLLQTATANSVVRSDTEAVGFDDAKITVMDTQGNLYSAWFASDQYSATGWRFYATKTFANGFISQQWSDVTNPCDSYTYPSILEQRYDTSLNKWILEYTDFAGTTWTKTFDGGSAVQSGSYGHDLGAGINVKTDLHGSLGHALYYYHQYPVCPAIAEQ